MHQIRKRNICRTVRNKRVNLGLDGILTVLAACVLAVLSIGKPVMSANAARTFVTLTAEENQAEVSLELSSENQAGQRDYGRIKALQLGFQVNILHGEGEDYQVSFLFDEGITGSVKQFSYQEETGLLQIYLSGEQDLYEGGSIILGKIVVESNGSADMTARIRVAEDSLKTVNDAFDLQEQPFYASEMVQVTTAKKQTGKDSGADQSEGSGSTSADEDGSREKPAGKTEAAAGSSETVEQEPLLRLVETEKRSRFSPNHFSLHGFLADEKACVVLGVVVVAMAAMILGMVVRVVHNRKKKKKKTWW